MLPKIELKNVSREDVDRMAWWLDSNDVAEKWFGHYSCGDPIHRSYDPKQMLESSDSEWELVFDNPNRLILSVYDEIDNHIGESQIVFNNSSGAELSIIIGRKDLWHRGFGTSALLVLLTKLFEQFGVSTVWVRVPTINIEALGLFEKLGFIRQKTVENCNSYQESKWSAVLALSSKSFWAGRMGVKRSTGSMPAVSITGLVGSKSKEVSDLVCQSLGLNLIDDEIDDEICTRLGSTPADLASFVSNYESFWSRLIATYADPIQLSNDEGASYLLMHPTSFPISNDLFEPSVNKKKYLLELESVIEDFSKSGKVLIHGHSSHLFISEKSLPTKVFIFADEETRSRVLSIDRGITLDDAQKIVSKEDKRLKSIHKYLFGSDIMDLSQYDVILNSSNNTVEDIAEAIIGILTNLSVEIGEMESARQSLSV